MEDKIVLQKKKNKDNKWKTIGPLVKYHPPIYIKIWQRNSSKSSQIMSPKTSKERHSIPKQIYICCPTTKNFLLIQTPTKWQNKNIYKECSCHSYSPKPLMHRNSFIKEGTYSTTTQYTKQTTPQPTSNSKQLCYMDSATLRIILKRATHVQTYF